MKFSIVTVVKNNPGIVEALQSIVNQRTDSPVEIIVIDGLSTDDTLERVREFGVRISTLVSERDKGIYDAMNKGLFRATGDVVGFLNSDDTYIDETVLESVDLAFRANPEAQAVYGDIIYTSSKVPGKVVRDLAGGRVGCGHHPFRLGAPPSGVFRQTGVPRELWRV